MISPELEERLRKTGWKGEITTERLLEALPKSINGKYYLEIGICPAKGLPYAVSYDSLNDGTILLDNNSDCVVNKDINEALIEMWITLKEKNLI